MHRVLLIDELLRQIFSYIESDDGSKTLSGPGRTCKAWAEPALDLVWMRLASVVPLLQLIPGVRLANGIYVCDVFFHSILSRNILKAC
jgi:hypothetical protein